MADDDRPIYDPEHRGTRGRIKALWTWVGRKHVGAIAAVVALLLALLLGVRASSATPEDRPPIPLAAGSWLRIPLPAKDGRAVYAVMASPSDPNTLYACVGPLTGSADPPPIGPIWVFRTRDRGADWVALALPALTGTSCSVSVAAGANGTLERVALMVETWTPQSNQIRACADTTLYLSDDEGDTWGQVPHTSIGPAPNQFGYCSFWPTAHHLFFEYSAGVTPPNPSSPYRWIQRTILERSDDDGRTWQRADNGLPPEALISQQLFDPAASSREDTMTAAIYPTYPGAAGMGIWRTDDAGRIWHQLSTVRFPGVNHGTARGDESDPAYLVFGDQVPAAAFLILVLQLGPTYQPAGTLPPLPVPNAAPGRAGLLQVLGALPDGRLVALGVSPDRGLWPLPPPDIPRLNENDYLSTTWLWLWDPGAARWMVVLAPLAAEPGPFQYGCGHCWESQITRGLGTDAQGRQVRGTYVWLHGWETHESAAYVLFVPDTRA